MHRAIICLVTLGLLLVPKPVHANPMPVEVYSPIPEAHTQIEAMAAPAALAPAAELERVYVPPANACLHGCGYAPENCTIFVALKRERSGHPVPDNLGNAANWAVNAAAQGIPIGSVPKAGAVGVSTAGYYGHVFYVESVNEDGSYLISEQNYDFNGGIRQRLVTSAAPYSFIYW